MKKLNLFLVFMLSIALVSCTQKTEKTKITVLQNKVEIQKPLEKIAKDFNSSQDEYEVEILGTNAEYTTLLQTSLLSKNGPTLFSTNGVSEFETFKDYAQEITNWGILDKVVANGLDEMSVDSKIMGIPTSMEGFGFIYNKTIFQELGIDETKLTTVEEFNKALKTLKDAGYFGVEIAPEGYFISAHLLNVPFAMQSDYKTFIKNVENKTQKLDTKEFEDWKILMDGIRETGDDVLSSSYDKSLAAFADSKAGMIHQGNWVYSVLSDYELDFEIGYLPMPILGNESLSVGIAQYMHLNKNADEKQQKGAEEFITYLFSDTKAQDIVAKEFGIIPPFTNFDSTKLNPLSQDILDYASENKTIPWTYGVFKAGIIDADFKPIMEEYFSNKITITQALEKIETKMQQ